MIRQPSQREYDIPDRRNALVLCLTLAAVNGCFVASAHASAWWQVALIAGAFAVVMNTTYAVIHEAEHAMLFSAPRVNDFAGAALAVLFPAPFHLIRQGHLGHHLRNRSDDEAFDLYFEGDNVVWRWLVWLGILTGGYYVLVAISNVIAAVTPFVFDRKHFKVERRANFDRASAAFMEAYNPKYTRLIWIEGVAACVIHTAIVWGLGIPLWHYVALYAAFGFTWSAMQYVHHFGTERHVTRGARNLFLFKPIDALWLNHNWHLTHHEHPTVPWVHLPKLATSEDAQARTRRRFLPWEYVRMWRGPKKTDERVRNKYAGRVIR